MKTNEPVKEARCRLKIISPERKILSFLSLILVLLIHSNVYWVKYGLSESKRNLYRFGVVFGLVLAFGAVVVACRETGESSRDPIDSVGEWIIIGLSVAVAIGGIWMQMCSRMPISSLGYQPGNRGCYQLTGAGKEFLDSLPPFEERTQRNLVENLGESQKPDGIEGFEIDAW